MKNRQIIKLVTFFAVLALILVLGNTILGARYKYMDEYPLRSVSMVYLSFSFVGFTLGLLFSSDYISHLWVNRAKKMAPQSGYIIVCIVLIALFVFEFTRIPDLYILLRASSYNVSKIINPYVLDFLLLGYLLPHTIGIRVPDEE